jgi:SAM-dependent methyltransferase
MTFTTTQSGLGIVVRSRGDTCRVCNNSRDNSAVTAREMMFGTREQFRYFSCAQCGCLQIAEIPADLARHYPDSYYSYSEVSAKDAPYWERLLLRARLRAMLGEKETLIGRIASARRPGPENVKTWFRTAGIRSGDSILDVGCGQGSLLVRLHREGFRRLTGVDPFIQHDLRYPGGVQVLKRDLAELEGSFDFVMSHHSFEHMPDPLGALKDVRRLLKRDRFTLVRIPVVAAAWEEYGIDWVQLDAPRHLYLHTERSMALLAEMAGFEIRHVVYDSWEFQFWGSEQYRMDIPLRESHQFTASQLSEFRARATELNQAGRGDQACFFLQAV